MISIKEVLEKIQFQDAYLIDESALISELLFDSRRLLLPWKTLFFAITTENHDGHDYIEDLIKKGVRNFIVTKSLDTFSSYDQCNFIRVANAVDALQQLVSAHRKLFSIPVVGITGSNGKTIVKEWISQMLSSDYHIIANPNSYNSQIGVPISVWQMAPHHNLAIFEAGISKPMEMNKLERIICPTIGILTNIGSAHSQFFDSDEQKLKEKMSLFIHCSAIIYCNDSPLIRTAFAKADMSGKQLLTWGHQEDSLFKIQQENVVDSSTIITLNGSEYCIPFTDDASVENALHAIVLLLHLNFSVSKINDKLKQLKAIDMRMEVKEAVNQSIVINDTYSLDFNSLQVALDFVKMQIRYTKKTVILSDFEQVGKLCDADYQNVNQLLQAHGITRLLAVGENMMNHQHCFTIAEQCFFASTSDLLRALPTLSFQHEAIVVKGARSFGFEKVVDHLQLRSHRTILQVNLPALVSNLNYYRSQIPPQTRMVAMVKAQCYGLGDVELINALQYHNIDYLAVAYTDEGVNLRKKNIQLPIIVLGAEGESYDMMLDYRLEPEIFNFYSLDELEKSLARHPENCGCRIHLKIDTGMHRIGFRKEEMDKVVERVKANPQLHIGSIFSHLAAAEDESQDTFTLSQIAYFKEVADAVTAQFDYPILRHIANTAGITRFPQAHFDMVRVGIGLYGFTSVFADLKHLQHVATLKTVITHIRMIGEGETVGYNRTYTATKPTKVGIIPLGYADGFPPELGRGVGSVIVNKKRVPIIGKICMDMTMIDLTGISANEGDEVIVYGEDNRIDDIAATIGKIPYHLLTAITKRVPRIYVVE